MVGDNRILHPSHEEELGACSAWGGGWASTWQFNLLALLVAVAMTFVLSCCAWFRRANRCRRREARSRLPVPIYHCVESIPPALRSILPDQATQEHFHAQDSPITMKSIIDLKDHISTELFFKMKKQFLLRELAKGRQGGESDPSRRQSERKYFQIEVRRDHVFDDSYSEFALVRDEDLSRYSLSISFLGEAGVDAGLGGVTRDWYTALSREFFNPQYGLFTRTADDYTFELNPDSGKNPDHLDSFRFIGTIVGKALFDGCLLDAHFNRLVYMRILNKSLTYHDIAVIDAQVYKSLVWLLENNLDGMDLGLTFSVDRASFGAYEEIELKPKGKEVNVCEANKREYVDLFSEWRLKQSVESQFQALRAGIARFVEPTLLQNFDENELEWLIGGVAEINVLDWRENTLYGAGYSDATKCQVIRWFWQLVESWGQEMRARLLQFVTGTPKVPYPEGFKGLRGTDGRMRFAIVCVSDSRRFPQSHTCFNELLLPNYDSYEELESKLTTAIFESGNQFHLK